MNDNKVVYDESIVKIETMKREQSFSPENIDLNFVEVSSMEGHDSIKAMPKRRKKRCKKSQSPALPKDNYSMDLNLTLKDRFRPIRPKPLQPGSSVLKHKFELPMMTTLPSNRVFVPSAMSIKEKIRYITPSNVSKNRIRSNSNNINNINNSDINNSNLVGNINIVNSNTINDSNKNSTINIVNMQPVTEEDKINETVEIQYSNTTANSTCNNNSNSFNTKNNSNNSSNSSNSSKFLRSIKATPKSHKSSIELFFESMAQTVLNLPNEVQADIKMQICKIVTMAEIQYCDSQVKSETKN